MAFNIVLQTSNSEKNKLDKSITDIATLSGTLKDTTSIIDPVIVIEGDLSSYVHCNYMTIETFGRSYFVTNIKSIRNGLFEITAHVDVLTTYKDNIRNLNAVYTRRLNDWVSLQKCCISPMRRRQNKCFKELKGVAVS